MKTLGIDIGTATTGWAILDKIGSSFKVFGFGVVSTTPKNSMPERLQFIYEELSTIIHKYKPLCMAVEELFYFKNKKTVIKVGQARGVVILAGINRGLFIYDYTPLQVKQAVTGYGRAEKSQIQNMVKMILNLKKIPKPDDVADALAIAICHLNTRKSV